MEPTTQELLAMIESLQQRVSRLEDRPEVVNKRSRAESAGEVALYCTQWGLTEEDGKWFFSKMVCSGWRNNGKPVRSWQHCITAWRLANIFPSQKRNGTGAHSVHDLKTVLEAKSSEKDALVRKHYNDSGAFPAWTNEPARQRFIILKREIINIQARIGGSA